MSGHPRPVVIVGDPVLHSPSETVTDFSDDLKHLIDDMFATMYLAEGVGLAAPQVGVGLRVFVYDCYDDEGIYYKGHIVNPVITATSTETDDGDEGCLSVPGPFATVARPHTVTVTGVDATGTSIEVTGSGFFARCLLHETEHLQGTLYIDHLNRRRRSRVLAAIEPYPWNADLPDALTS
ncbi:MAG: peptide deformylase [Pseudonocardiales bacterium]|nr:peptide deformylase [Pseudonocardiales bacterium]